jgi:enoyl-CoA hydratase
MACDIRIAAEGAKFGIPAAKLSVGYAPAGIGTLMSLVGPSMVKDIFYSARQLSAEEALRIGFVNQVVAADALDAHVEDYANTIAGNAPLTIAAVKKAVTELLKDEKDRDMAAAEQLQAACFASQDYIEGQAAFAEKRKPRFQGR